MKKLRILIIFLSIQCQDGKVTESSVNNLNINSKETISKTSYIKTSTPGIFGIQKKEIYSIQSKLSTASILIEDIGQHLLNLQNYKRANRHKNKK
ncbi:hypothetical protein [Aquimarina sp. RZ0]|uniref:hypothetical protein n=1 Tax=Aquimarina sp. RZ0 TaxID=2607730 RepID=UPI0011F0C32C|nr:hypothetical protein [Aquimarina sp. RZ0]KAA1247957.1 hypothetical protein F0000_01695 [Aquimarina sp. RZ0]